MERERFTEGWSIVITTIFVCILFIVIGYSERGIDKPLLEGVLISIGLNLWIIYNHYNTYLEIQNKRTLISKGYRTFGYDTVDLYDIKYVLRAQAFLMKSWGSLMMIIYEDPETGLRYTAARERIYRGETLKAFLTRIHELNPSIDLDSDYLDLIEGRLDPFRLNETPAKRTMQKMEGYLTSKGEQWKQKGFVQGIVDWFNS